MYARLTDRARKVMQLANQEALRFNHEYIGTEHLLLGLVKEGGIAARVLEALDIDRRKIRLAVERLIHSGPFVVAMGNPPQTPRAKKVIEYSMEEARNLNHNYVGTEHILLGLLRETESVAAQILINFGLTLDLLRAVTVQVLRQEIQNLERGIPGACEAGTAQHSKEIEAEIDRLQKQKEDAIASLDFEKAAALRDQIENIKRNAQLAVHAKIEELKQQFQSRLHGPQAPEPPVGDFPVRPPVPYSP